MMKYNILTAGSGGVRGPWVHTGESGFYQASIPLYQYRRMASKFVLQDYKFKGKAS